MGVVRERLCFRKLSLPRMVVLSLSLSFTALMNYCLTGYTKICGARSV